MSDDSLRKLAEQRAAEILPSHYYCEDPWYSCPLAEDGCADESAGEECRCGLEGKRAQIVEAILASHFQPQAPSDEGSTDINAQVWESFKDKEYRDAYMDSHLRTVVAAQIKILREQRNLTQKQLAALCGMAQERISVLEDVNYDNWNVETLRRLASAFDVRLAISFESFSSGLHELLKFGRTSLERPSFSEDSIAKSGPQAGSERVPFDPTTKEEYKAMVQTGLETIKALQEKIAELKQAAALQEKQNGKK